MGVYIKGINKWTVMKILAGDYPYYLDKITEIDLIRCGECKHYGFKETDRGGFPCCTNVIGATPYRMPTDFCSYGERRADGKEIL